MNEKIIKVEVLPRRVGAPSKYTPQISERWVDARSNGSSIAQSMLLCNIRSWETYKRWQVDHIEFKEAVEFGDIVSQAGWEKIGEMGIKGEIDKFNASTFIFMMCNRYPQYYRQQNNGSNVNVQVNNLLSDRLKSLTKEELNTKALDLARKLIEQKQE